jgi:hypothetical protein
MPAVSAIPTTPASCGDTRELFARDLFDALPADCTAPSRQSGTGLRGVRALAASCKADWTQLTMELFQGDSYPYPLPHQRSRGRPTLS